MGNKSSKVRIQEVILKSQGVKNLLDTRLTGSYKSVWVWIALDFRLYLRLDVMLVNITNNAMTVCYYHVTYAFQSESTLYSCLNVKELFPQIPV